MRFLVLFKESTENLNDWIKSRVNEPEAGRLHAIISLIYFQWFFLWKFWRIVLNEIFYIIFYENIRGFITLAKLVKNSAKDEEVNGLFDAFKLEYLEGGWEIVICLNRTWNLFAVFWGFFILNDDHPMKYRLTHTFPLVFLTFLVVDKISQKYKSTREVWMIAMNIFLYIVWLKASLIEDKYVFNEMWIAVICLSQYWTMFMCLTWKKLVGIIWISLLLLLVLVTKKYENVSLALYISIFMVWSMFSITTVFYWTKIKETILLIKTNKDLIHTIRSILQMFPEGVLIRSFDDTTKKIITVYANDVAKNILFNGDIKEQSIKDYEVTKIDMNIQFEEWNEEKWISMNDFLNTKEIIWDDTNNMNKINEELIEIRKKLKYKEDVWEIDEIREESQKLYYSVKTIKVNWEDNQHSYLHVFIDTTQIKKLEEERAKGKVQQLMFASVSHELRTPLNAFVNSQQFIGFTLADLKKRLEKLPEASAKVESLYPKFEKFLKVGEVSSKLLMVLVEDILDFVKFSSNTFALNIEWFWLKDLLTEIYFIFSFQCEEKHLQFNIEWDDDLKQMMFRSDVRRIKQVLINLISNSYKFTEVGGIKVWVKMVNKRNRSFLQFSVVDTGIGINEQDIPKLFKMFSMIQKNGNQISQWGSGIGLSISKKIVESLGGEIGVESKEAEWTNFTFTTQNILNSQPLDISRISSDDDSKVFFLSFNLLINLFLLIYYNTLCWVPHWTTAVDWISTGRVDKGYNFYLGITIFSIKIILKKILY